MTRAIWVLRKLWLLWLVSGSVIIGIFHSWPVAFGAFWFGASLMVLVLVLASFRSDMAARFPEQ